MKEQSKDDGIWPIPCFFIRLGARRTGVTEAARPAVGRVVIRRNLRTGERQLSHCLPAGSSNNRSRLPEQGYCARPCVGSKPAGGAQVNLAEVECFMESVVRAGLGG
ncbi:MAG TPA: hypothetical protein VME46_14965 [Acidimicrobiales bacterium]|nr:hypothetical protein [Acidimicrobiales bacterium]